MKDLIFYVVTCLTSFVIGRIIYITLIQNNSLKKNVESVKTMIILGSGGHTTEMMKIIEHLDFNIYTPRVYVYSHEDKMSIDKLKTVEKSVNNDNKINIIPIMRSRKVGQSYLTSVITTLIAFLRAFKILYDENPDLIICNGPGTGVPLCLCAYLLRIIFCSKAVVIFVESFCRVKTFSLSGKILYYFADYVIVQWPKLYDKNNKNLHLMEMSLIAPLTSGKILNKNLIDEYKNCIDVEIRNYVGPLSDELYLHLEKNERPSNSWINNTLLRLEACLDRIWEELNTGHWKDVSINHRYSYTICTILKCIVLEISSQACENETDKEKNFEKIIQQIDKGLLLGAPLENKSSLLTDIASKISEYFSKKISIDIESFCNFSEYDTSEVDLLPGCEWISRQKIPSMEKFYCEIFMAKIPSVLEGCIDHWKALKLWKNPKYLIKTAGMRTVPIEIGSSYAEDEWSQNLIFLKDFIKLYMTKNTEKIGYLAQHQLFEQVPELKQDFTVPDYCSFMDDEDTPVDVNVWFGPKGTKSPLHYDAKNNLLCQVFGAKKIILYHPDDEKYLYPYDSRLLHNTAQVHPYNPDYEKFAEFKNAKGLMCCLKQGEILYIPPGWWHHVTSLSPSCSISFWWT